VFHDEIDTIAALAAAEALENILVGVDDKRRRFFLMEGAIAFQDGARFSEIDKIPHHVLYLGRIHDFCYGVAGDQVELLSCLFNLVIYHRRIEILNFQNPLKFLFG